MTTTESVEYDRLGRIVRQTDVLGRVTATAYSEDGLTETVTTPSGATLVTEYHADGSVLHEYGTGQRERCHVYDIDNNCLRKPLPWPARPSSFPGPWSTASDKASCK